MVGNRTVLPSSWNKDPTKEYLIERRTFQTLYHLERYKINKGETRGEIVRGFEINCKSRDKFLVLERLPCSKHTKNGIT
jgi:hypothetical protein